jgi:hypothetical protein
VLGGGSITWTSPFQKEFWLDGCLEVVLKEYVIALAECLCSSEVGVGWGVITSDASLYNWGTWAVTLLNHTRALALQLIEVTKGLSQGSQKVLRQCYTDLA